MRKKNKYALDIEHPESRRSITISVDRHGFLVIDGETGTIYRPPRMKGCDRCLIDALNISGNYEFTDDWIVAVISNFWEIEGRPTNENQNESEVK